MKNDKNLCIAIATMLAEDGDAFRKFMAFRQTASKDLGELEEYGIVMGMLYKVDSKFIIENGALVDAAVVSDRVLDDMCSRILNDDDFCKDVVKAILENQETYDSVLEKFKEPTNKDLVKSGWSSKFDDFMRRMQEIAEEGEDRGALKKMVKVW